MSWRGDVRADVRANARRRDRLRIRRLLRPADHRAELARRRVQYAAARGTPEHDTVLASARQRAAARHALLSPEELDVARKGPAPRF